MFTQNDQLPSIDADTLNEVTGGVASQDAQLTAAIQGIQSSIKSIGAANNSNNNALAAFLPFLMFARAGSGGLGGACPCGCGMANCRR